MAEKRAGCPPGIVFTDLDGTLLDHDTYDALAAAPALQALGRRGVPVVLCSSKTRAEILAIQGRLGLSGPFIPENGGAVLLAGGGPLEALFPERWAGLPAAVFGTPYSELRSALAGLREEVGGGPRGFGDATDAEVARWTGLAEADAHLARQRDFDEPFLWDPEPAAEVVAAARAWLARRGLGLTRGGRFWHLLGRNDKGRAVGWLLDALASRCGVAPPSLALGDSENDLPMLRRADERVLVERPGGGHLVPRPAALQAVEGVGPVGWARAVLAWLDGLGR
ncbi:MAG: HAD-IIB family hydrolase [Deferrisomatales bacterium]